MRWSRPLGQNARQIVESRADECQLANQVRRLGQQHPPNFSGLRQVAFWFDPPLPLALDRAPESLKGSQQTLGKPNRSGCNQLVLDELLDRKSLLARDKLAEDLQSHGADQGIEQRPLLAPIGIGRMHGREPRQNRPGALQRGWSFVLDQRRRDQVDMQHALGGRSAAAKLDAAKPAIGQRRDDFARFVIEAQIR